MREDVAAALQRLETADPRASKALQRRLDDVGRLEELLRPDEQVLWVQAEDHIPGLDGKIDGRTIAHGVLALSDARLLFAGSTAVGSWEYGALVSAAEPPPTFGGLRKLVVSSNQGEVVWFTLTQRDATAQLLATLDRMMPGRAKTATPATEAARSSLVEELQQLADLHASGALSDDEFNAAKARLLGS